MDKLYKFTEIVKFWGASVLTIGLISIAGWFFWVLFTQKLTIPQALDLTQAKIKNIFENFNKGGNASEGNNTMLLSGGISQNVYEEELI